MIVIRKGENPEEKRTLMMEIRRKLERGADFAGLARLYSEDSNREKGGDWGWIDRKTLNPILTRAAFTAPNGKVSDIVEIADSFYLLKAEGRRGGTVKPLAAVRDQIQRFLTEQERQKQQQAWTKRLREKAFVKIY
jgi:peptidyl-prolyl cis-trans isomerase SurA